MTTDEQLLTTAQAADRLGVTVRTVSRWADSGRLPEAMKLAGLRGPRLFRVTDVDRLRDVA